MNALKMYDSDLNHVAKLTDETTYQLWKFQVNITVKSQGLDDIASGQLQLKDIDPKDSTKVAKFIKEDAKVQNIIMLTVSKTALMHIMACQNSYEMLEKLKLIFEKDTDVQRCSLLETFYNFKMDMNSSLLQQLAALENLVFRLKAVNETISDEMVMAKIITALPTEYNFFKSAWESTAKVDRTVANLTSRLSGEEAKLKTENSEGTLGGSVAYKAQGRFYKPNISGSKNPSKKKLFCENCKMNNHLIDTCYKLKGNRPKPKFCEICKKKVIVTMLKNVFFVINKRITVIRIRVKMRVLIIKVSNQTVIYHFLQLTVT